MLKELGIESRLIDKDVARRIEPQLDLRDFSLIAYESESGYAEPSLIEQVACIPVVEKGIFQLSYTGVYDRPQMNN